MNETTAPTAGTRLSLAELRLLLRRAGSLIATLLVIAYLASFGLLMSERGRLHLPARPLDALWQALGRTFSYFVDHPAAYYARSQDIPAWKYVGETLWISAGLLLVSLTLAALVGMLLGVTAALSRRKVASSLMMLLSVIGVSTPSFLLAMLFWIVNIRVHQTFQIVVLPSAGFGWDAHLVLPALVLAMRPLAQIAQVTYVTLTDIMKQDFIRTARAKGLSWRLVRQRHAMRNVMIPILNTIGTSLRFSLASLPVVEIFFNWPGVGQVLMKAVEQANDPLVTDLILALGLFFLLVNLAIEIFFPLIDPRVRQEEDAEGTENAPTLRGLWEGMRVALRDWLRGRGRVREALPPLPAMEGGQAGDRPDYSAAHRRWYVRKFFTNVPLLVGLALVLGLAYLTFAGDRLTEASPYQIHGIMMVEGKIGSPPYPPSETFPWGTDNVGRDLQALVLSGTRQTMTLAFFGMLARLGLGVFLGALAGWRRGGWFDRLVTGAVGVWAAFPVTLFAMLLIQALGIQQGIWVFVVAFSLVGWGEVAQFVRGQVISIKPQLYIESARSSGASPVQTLVRHVAPNLVNPLIVLAVLEMGGVLMLIAELGFLNIFLGGGFRLMVGEGANMVPIMVDFSDVPEWASLIATVRLWWRSYPWMAWYPGMAFFLAIMAFNVLGDGLRRFLDESQANLSRLFNRYTLAGAVALVIMLNLFLRASGPIGSYAEEAQNFNTQRAMADIAALASPEFAGRETGTPGNLAAAEYIAAQMEAAGLQPAGGINTYIQALGYPRPHLIDVPRLEILDAQEQVQTSFEYRTDFCEYIGSSYTRWGRARAPLVGLAFGALPEGDTDDPYRIVDAELYDKIVLVRKEAMPFVPTNRVVGILAVTEDPLDLVRRDVFPSLFSGMYYYGVPTVYITPQVAELLLATAGSSLEDLDRQAGLLGKGGLYQTVPGATLFLSVEPTDAFSAVDEYYYNVIGYIPGTGSEVGMDDNVILVTAYFDGLGVGPDGTFYPSANDNASGVAAMLEIARLLKQSPYQPKKTVMFVAWSGGERREGMSVSNIMNAQSGMNRLTVETVIELSGVGAGDGEGIAIGDDSSSRLVQLVQDAARRFNVPTTTRGRDPHYGYYIRPALGGRSATTLSVSWDGADHLAHTPMDDYSYIDPEKLGLLGRTVYLTMLVISRETEY